MSWIDDLYAAWGREYPHLDVSALPPMVRLARLSILIDAFQHEVLEPFELTPGDYGVLAALRRAGSPYQLSPTLLTSRLQRSSGGITKMLKRLEDRGFVKRAPDPDDRRGSLVRLTKSGLAVQERIFNAFLTASDDVFAPLGRKSLRTADQGLAQVLEAFERWASAEESS
ncbi:MAG: MarR family transcriptional regulator [Proteobacteria bacterium]|nr:MarR family transcriptional regulator [Pseudomonadota bacterium]